MFQVDFAFNDAPALKGARCYMCSGTTAEPVLTIKTAHYLHSDLTVGRCINCGSVNFLDDDPVLGYDHDGFNDEYWYNYVQNGAGISAMLEPLLSIDRPRQASLLDIGCGFGFVPHFWQSKGFGTAIGLETSIYGKVGREKLGVDIIHAYYNQAERIQGQKFDYVFSSEVIEHVDDPAAFLAEIGQGLADDGILVLTTPSAQAVNQNTDYTTLIATLSPGFHYFVASQSALEKLLHDAGYEHVLVRDAGHRLFAWASHVPLPHIKDGFSDWDIYLDYLEKVAESSDPHIASGGQYRVLKDSMNLGQFDRAERIFPKFQETCKTYYDLDLHNINQSANWRRARTELDNKKYPSWMGCGFLFSGLYLKRKNASEAVVRSLLEAAVETMETEIDLAAQFAGEPAHFITMAREELAQLSRSNRKSIWQKLGFFAKS